MGEKEGKRGEEKQNKQESGPTTVVLKVDLHCEGCAQKVKRSVKRFDGVESVSTDMASNKLTVVGKLDPVKLRERVEEKTKKKVEIVSPAGIASAKTKGGGGDAKKPAAAAAGDGDVGGAKEVKISPEEKAKSPHASNAVSKIRLIHTVLKRMNKVKVIEGEKKESGGGIGGKKEGGDSEKKKVGGEGEKQKEGEEGGKDKKAEGGDKKKEGGEGGNHVKEGDKVVEGNKMEYYGSPYGYPVEMAPTPYEYRYDMAPMSNEYRYGMTSNSSGHRYEMAPVSSEYRYDAASTPSSYQVEMPPAPYWHRAEMSQTPQIFSDENPNACFIM